MANPRDAATPAGNGGRTVQQMVDGTLSIVTAGSDDSRADALADAMTGAGLRLSRSADRLRVNSIDLTLAAEIVAQIAADLARALARAVAR